MFTYFLEEKRLLVKQDLLSKLQKFDTCRRWK